MIRFSEARRRDVVTTDTAETVGRVEHFVVDPTTQRVVALRLGKVGGDGDTVDYDRLGSFGRDVVTVPGVDALRAPGTDREKGVGKDFGLLGKQVLGDDGRHLGKVEDVEFDPDGGRVHALLTRDDEIAGERLLGIGSYAVVVRRAQ